MSKISHKELLTFSNLTKLEWQFVEKINNTDSKKDKLKDSENADKKDKEQNETEHSKLRDLLTPGNFERIKEEDGKEIRRYIYGGDGQGNCDTSKGLQEMRKYAGVAMGYKEADADFLNDWEVMYAGDRYKVIRDFYDGLLQAKNDGSGDIPEPGDEEHPLPSRDEVEEDQNQIGEINTYIEGISIGAKLIPLTLKLGFADDILNLGIFYDDIVDTLDNPTQEIAQEALKKMTKANPEKLLMGNTKSWSVFALNHGFDISQETLQSKVQTLEQDKMISSEDILETEEEKLEQEEYPQVGFTKKFNLKAGTKERDGFRAVVFKRDNQIVIAYRASEDTDEKTLPPDRDLLQLVYNRVYFNYCKGNNKANINFVGFNEGADLGAVSSLLYEETCSAFYTQDPMVKGYIDFTPEDLNSNYQTTSEIYTESAQTLAIESALELTTGILLSQSVIPGLIFLSAVEMFDVLEDLIEQKRINDFYKKLQSWGIIESQKKIGEFNTTKQDKTQVSNPGLSTSGINNESKQEKLQGKISSVIEEQEAQRINLGDAEVKIKMSDVFYIWSRDISDKFQETSEGVYEAKYDPEMIMSGSIWGTGKSIMKKCTLEKNTNNIYEITKVQKLKTGDFTQNESIDITDKIVNISNLLYNTIKYIRSLQQSYLNNEPEIEYIYSELSEGKEAGQEQIQIKPELPAQIKYRPIIEHLGQKEYAFLPYLKEDTLNTEGQLNQEYKRKAIEGMLARVPHIMEQDVYDRRIQINVSNINHIEVNGDKLKPEFIEETDSGEYKIRCNFKDNPVEKVLKKFLQNDNIGPQAFADFHYYKKVYNNLDKLIQNNYSIHRQGPFNSEITLDSKSEKKGLQFTSSANIVDKLIIQATNLPEYALGYLLGSKVGEEKAQPGTIKLDPDKEKELQTKDYNSDSTIKIKGTQIGQEITKVQDKNRIYRENQEYLEEYQEEIEVEEEDQEDIKIRYIYKCSTNKIEFGKYEEDRFTTDYPVLMIRYGYGDSYDNVFRIDKYTHRDYGIDLPRYHKVLGSLDKEVAKQVSYEFKYAPDKIQTKEETDGNRNSSLWVEDQELGQEIIPLQEIRKKDTTVLRFVEASDNAIPSPNVLEDVFGTKGDKVLNNPIFYEYDIETNRLTVYYGFVYRYKEELKEDSDVEVYKLNQDMVKKQDHYTHLISGYGHKIVIEDFKDGDYNLDLSLDKYMFQGSKRKQGDEEEREYKINKTHNMVFAPRSNGKGNIVVDDQYALNDQKIYNIPNENKYDFIIDKIEAEGKRLHQKIGKLANNLRYTVMRDNIKLMYIYDHLEKTLFVFYPDENSDAQTRFEVEDEEIIIKDYHKIEIRDFDIENKDYGIELPLEEINLTGLNQTKKVEIEEGDTLSSIAEEELEDKDLWNQLEKSNGNKFTAKEARNLKPGQEVYMPDREQNIEEKTLKEDIKIKTNSSNDIDSNYNGQGKIQVDGKYIGKDIHTENEKKWQRKIFIDQEENSYQKIGNVLIIRFKNDKNKRKKLVINGFKEGSFGLWLEKIPPAQIGIDDSKVKSDYTDLKAEQGKVKGVDENKFIKEEKRIQDDFLYILPWEQVYKPVEEREQGEEQKQEQKPASASSGVNTRKKTKRDRDIARIKRLKNKNIQVQTGSTCYVVAGAQLQCSCGTAPCSLIVPPGKVMIEKKPMANMMHFKPMTNITPFGMCTTTANPVVASATAAPPSGVLKPQPCIPQLTTPWMKPKPNVLVQGQPAITENSRLICMWSGQISIQDPGQSTAVAH